MTKADKQIIETLRKAQERCEELGKSRCDECPFVKGDLCLVAIYVEKLAKLLHRWPSEWDMEEIERIITDGDV